MIRILCGILLLILSIGFSGCASVTRGTMDALEVNTVPPGAEVSVTRIKKPMGKKEIKKNMSEEDAAKLLEDKDSEFYGPFTATTPASFALSRKGNYEVVISKPGYETVEITVGHKIAGAGAAGMAGNALVGGVIGVAVDASTGATLSLTPNPISLNLEKKH